MVPLFGLVIGIVGGQLMRHGSISLERKEAMRLLIEIWNEQSTVTQIGFVTITVIALLVTLGVAAGIY